ncbi:MAG: helix-turn-helix transcriptional regulator [Candidatus Bathyarchaeia archaeon]|jgi:hypothetical protein
MRRTSLFIIITVVALSSLGVVLFTAYYVLSAATTQQYYSNWMGQMWGSMMGGGMMNENGVVQNQNSIASYFGFAFLILVGVAVVGIVGMVYFFLFPEIRPTPVNVPPLAGGSLQAPANVVSAYESVLKTLHPNERKVVEVLRSHGGKYLQKYIRSETGFSRLQTHRILARLAERGVVLLEKTGNTNMVLLADWLK